MGRIDTCINQVAGRQFGSISTKQLRELGVDRSAVRRRVADGRLRRVLPNTFVLEAVANAPGDDALQMAAVLEAGPGAALSHASAARRLGVWERGDQTIHVSAPRQHRPVGDPRFEFHRTSALPCAQVGTVGGIPTTTFARTCRDMAAHHTPHQLAHVLYEGAARGLLQIDAMGLQLAAAPGRAGGLVLREALALYLGGSAGTRTATEDRFLELVLEAELPMPIVNTAGATRVIPEELDFVWPQARLVLEIDGSNIHGRPGVGRRDVNRDAVLADARWECMRVPPRRVWRDPEGLVAGLLRRGLATSCRGA